MATRAAEGSPAQPAAFAALVKRWRSSWAARLEKGAHHQFFGNYGPQEKQVNTAPDDGAGLAGAGAGDDQQRSLLVADDGRVAGSPAGAAGGGLRVRSKITSGWISRRVRRAWNGLWLGWDDAADNVPAHRPDCVGEMPPHGATVAMPSDVKQGWRRKVALRQGQRKDPCNRSGAMQGWRRKVALRQGQRKDPCNRSGAMQGWRRKVALRQGQRKDPCNRSGAKQGCGRKVALRRGQRKDPCNRSGAKQGCGRKVTLENGRAPGQSAQSRGKSRLAQFVPVRR